MEQHQLILNVRSNVAHLPATMHMRQSDFVTYKCYTFYYALWRYEHVVRFLRLRQEHLQPVETSQVSTKKLQFLLITYIKGKF